MSHPLRGFCFLTASCREVILLGVHRIPCWLLRAASRLLPSVTISAHAVNTLIILLLFPTASPAGPLLKENKGRSFGGSDRDQDKSHSAFDGDSGSEGGKERRFSPVTRLASVPGPSAG